VQFGIGAVTLDVFVWWEVGGDRNAVVMFCCSLRPAFTVAHVAATVVFLRVRRRDRLLSSRVLPDRAGTRRPGGLDVIGIGVAFRNRPPLSGGVGQWGRTCRMLVGLAVTGVATSAPLLRLSQPHTGLGAILWDYPLVGAVSG